MANILKRREAGISKGFNGFDLSHEVDFTSTVGQIIPIHYDRLQPKDKVRISTDMFSRLMPTNSASPITLTTHVDYFFVPYRLLFSLMPSMLADVNDWHSTLMERTKGTNMSDYPHFQLDYLFNQAMRVRAVNGFIVELDNFGDEADFENASQNLGSRILLQLLGYGDFGKDYSDSFRDVSNLVPDDPDDPDSEKVISWYSTSRSYDVFNLLAYQCIWQWYYRLDTREELNREAYNCDKWYNQVADLSTGILPWTKEYEDTAFSYCPFLQIRYRPWKRDFYTLNEISPLGSPASFSHYHTQDSQSSNAFSNWIKEWLSEDVNEDNFNVTPESLNINDIQPDNGKVVKFPVFDNPNGAPNGSPSTQSTQAHRIAAIIEKLSAIWQQTGKTYKDQMEKQFGVKLGEHLSSRPIYIGSQSSVLDMKPIVADVETSEMSAGTITGYGVAKSDDKQGVINFEAPEHGVFMALYSAVPEAVYRPVGLDFVNTYQSRADFPLPVTDELGQRPLFGFEVVNTGVSAKNNARLGWLARHQELKLKRDMRYTGFDATLAYWIPVRTDEQYSNDLASYYINPDYLNDIMLVNYSDFDKIDGDLEFGWLDNAAFDGDPLMNFYKVHCFKSSKQSTYGVPQNFFG